MDKHLLIAIACASIGALLFKKKPKMGKTLMIIAASHIVVVGFEPLCQFIQSLF